MSRAMNWALGTYETNRIRDRKGYDEFMTDSYGRALMNLSQGIQSWQEDGKPFPQIEVKATLDTVMCEITRAKDPITKSRKIQEMAYVTDMLKEWQKPQDKK